MNTTSRAATVGLGLVLPVLLIVLILGADYLESPKTAYVGVLAVVPMLSAVFATPRITALVAVITWLSAFTFGQLASDGNVGAQQVRLVIIALSGLAAVGAATLRGRRERALVAALQEAAAAEQLRARAETDQLTGLANRHGLTTRVAAADPSITRTVALIDCDGLKIINDSLGHLAGDEYLTAIAGRVVGSLSKDDLVARWGGDEFLVVQRLDVQRAMVALQRMHGTVSGTPLGIAGTMTPASVSIGVAEWRPGMTFDEALQAADTAMYEAKATGRDRIVIAGGGA
jgi:diguanylate cyclase (GGDEF)-like protein